MAQAQSRIENLTGLLDALARLIWEKQASSPEVTVGDVVEVMGRRAYGPLLLVIGVLSISPAALLPGSTWAFAMLTLVISAQMLLNRESPWLPARALKLGLPGDALSHSIERARPLTRRIDKLVHPRMDVFTHPPWVSGVAIACIGAALITFPLSLVPAAPFAPGLAIILFGLGMTARDGLLLSVGAALVAAIGLTICFAVLL